MKEKWAEYIRHYEGLRLKPYMCPSGHLTIGYGHNLENAIPLKIAEELLQADLAYAQMEVGGKFPWSNRLDEVRQFVLIDMCFTCSDVSRASASLPSTLYPFAATPPHASASAKRI